VEGLRAQRVWGICGKGKRLLCLFIFYLTFFFNYFDLQMTPLNLLIVSLDSIPFGYGLEEILTLNYLIVNYILILIFMILVI
jgi:hypothetical protein